jgi:GMP synthase (glutamine-hydrolysing)
VDAYKYAGYFPPEEADEVKAMSRRSDVTQPPLLLRRFVARYADRSPVPAG